MYSIAKEIVLRHKIKKIEPTASKKIRNYSWDSTSDETDYDYSLYIYSDWDEDRRPAGLREINRLDHVVTDNIKTNKDQHNEAIYNELTFDTNGFNLSSGT